jgi:hypothetical protein
MIVQTAAEVPVRDDRGHEFACAKAAGAGISQSAGISVTARTRNACAWSGAGRRRGGKPNGAKKIRSKPSMPRRNVRAVVVPSLCHNPRTILKLRMRVVTQQKEFCQLLYAADLDAMIRP